MKHEVEAYPRFSITMQQNIATMMKMGANNIWILEWYSDNDGFRKTVP
jgi:hypothetical protein